MDVSGQIHDPAALPPGKGHLVPFGQEVGWPHSRSGRSGGEKNYQPLSEREIPIIQLEAQRYTAELYRLLFNPLTTLLQKLHSVKWEVEMYMNK
jgi:hypothetical protein